TTTIYVQFAPGAEQAYSDDIVHTSTGATQIDVAVSGNGVPVGTPIITKIGGDMNFGDIIIDNTSSPQQYSISGINLSDDIVITSPSGFEISLDNSDYSVNPIALIQTGGDVANTTIYTRFAPTASVSYSENITHVSSGATTVTVSVSGNGICDNLIVSNPGNSTNCIGETVNFTVTATGTGLLSYVWKKGATILSDGGDISGAATNSISIANIQAGDAGAYTCEVTDECNNTEISAEGVLDIPTAVNIVSQPTPLAICEGEEAQFTVSATGDGLSYQWKKGSANVGTDLPTYTIVSALVADSDDYTCVVSGACGGQTTSVATLTVMSNPTVDLGSDQAVCEGGTVSLDAGAGFETYVWSTGEATQTVEVTTSGTYAVTVTNTSDCEAFDEVEVMFNTNPTVDLGSDQAVCDGETVSLDAGAGFETYVWSTGETTQSIEVTTSGTYAVTVTNTSDCEALDEVEVMFNTNPTVDLGSDQTACEGETVSLDAGAGFETYVWSTGETTQTIQVTTPGTYAVTVTNTSDCEGVDEVEVTFNTSPTVDLGSDQAVCEGETVSLDAGAGFETYVWSTGEATQTIEVTTSGTYAVTVVNSSGCEGAVEVEVLFNTNPAVDLGSDQAVCDGETVTLDAGTGFETYAWSTGEITQTIEVTTSGTYVVTVTNSSDCEAFDEVEVMFNTNPTVDLGSDQAVCDGETVTLDAGTGFETYVWSTGETTQTIEVTTPGTYAVTVANTSDCEASDEVEVVVYSLPIVDLGNDTAIFNNDSILLDAGSGFIEYLWNDGSGNQTFLVRGPVLDTVAHEFAVTVTNDNYCSNSDTIIITINNYIGIFASGATSSTIKVYPVPTEDFLNFSTDLTILKVMVYDNNGQLAISNKNINDKVDVSSLKPGVYILKLIDSMNQSYDAMFIKK
ncbi:MAG: T9SS type A sorting domain-containing protein, partial [Salinivirgaceae bacterium]|nr:T9SS type A sorting domain-containing protein [Salinivirgaceae bacterium]